jgi:hypothetical protein
MTDPYEMPFSYPVLSPALEQDTVMSSTESSDWMTPRNPRLSRYSTMSEQRSEHIGHHRERFDAGLVGTNVG